DYPGTRGHLFHGNGDGTFAEVPLAEGVDSKAAHGVAVADFDRDGDLDVVSSDDLSGNVLLHRNGNASGGGDGSVWTTFDVALGLGSASGVAVGDMDGDGILDVTATDFTGDTVRWWRNADRAAPAFTGQSSVTVQSANHVAVADVDRDGALDWVASGGTGTLSWFANDGAGGAGWVEENIATLGTVQDVRVADIDVDGDLDVTATTLNPGADAFYWWRNDDGTGTDWTGLSRSITFAAGLDVGDLDGDGDLDVASADFGLDAQWYETDLFQADVSSQDGASVTALDEGTEGRLLEVRYEHLGRTGDRDGCATSLRVVFESSTGVAMTSAQLDALVDEVRVRADDGDGTFETSDTELHSSTTHVLDVDGGVDLALTCAPTAFVAFDFDQLWVTVELEEDAADQTVTTVLASVDGTATVAIDAESVLDIELSARGTHTPSSVVTATQVVDVAPPAPAPADDDDDDDDRDERRIAGTNRYETAAALSARMGNVDTVYVATGHDYADALAVGPVAGIEGAALLLVEPDAVPEATADELERIGAARVVVVGGTAAVSDAVFDAVGADERIAGPTRYETAAALAADAFPLGASTVHLVSGSSFADASSAGPSAGLAGGPILLVRSDGTIPAAAAEQLTRLAPTTVVVVGGGGAISSRVVDAVGAVVPAATVERAGGVSRYLTAVALAERLGADVDTVYVATGLDFADALAAAPAAIDDRAPILLVPVDTPVPDGVVAYVDRIDPEDVLVIGGTAAVPRARVAELR
ncbi:MAG TPA: cell wall-binding repeat-containing protein, partial [Acidimicrobiales bacterium]|nr:cell wall-binding repeat-containing protein [Acidimicrobiales bacterium]